MGLASALARRCFFLRQQGRTCLASCHATCVLLFALSSERGERSYGNRAEGCEKEEGCDALSQLSDSLRALQKAEHARPPCLVAAAGQHAERGDEHEQRKGEHRQRGRRCVGMHERQASPHECREREQGGGAEGGEACFQQPALVRVERAEGGVQGVQALLAEQPRLTGDDRGSRQGDEAQQAGESEAEREHRRHFVYSGRFRQRVGNAAQQGEPSEGGTKAALRCKQRVDVERTLGGKE